MQFVDKFFENIRKSSWLTAFLLLVTGILYSLFSLSISGRGEISCGGSPVLFFWNTLPLVLMLFFLWLSTGLSWLASLLTGAVAFLLTGGNYFKVLFRDDPLVWADLHNLREGLQMAGTYEVKFTPMMYGMLLSIFVLSAALFVFGKKRPGLTVRLLTLTVTGLLCVICFYQVYPDNNRYSRLAGEYRANVGNAYASCGMIYPFFHSYGEYSGASFHYDRKSAKDILESYQDADIPEKKKVSLIGIQLEAYADLSIYGIEGLNPAVYRDFHTVQSRSYSGRLVTDIFAGGTTESEWAVLTGGNHHGDFLTWTDSVAWYLKGQGYVTGGGHPSHEWFYNRSVVNPNLGLDDYLFMENYYNRYSSGDVAYDDVFFPDLEKRIGDHFAQSDAPLFSFNVTYQGHGPYESEMTYWGSSYCTGNFETSTRNILNNYFHLMQDTGSYLVHLLDYLDTLDEPVVLFLYGDHKPWMGNQGCIYEGLGISLDTATEEGFLNYYSTWYTIWGNQAAKDVLDCDFTGKGPDLSPCFLMNEVFKLCGWEGSAYMQAQREVAETLPVLHTTGWVKENGVYCWQPSPSARALMDQFQNVSRYDRTRTS